tara:strand:+ start:860 stop:1114 length:255 start_codon:yes stop_codon:yes gene_type:complete
MSKSTEESILAHKIYEKVMEECQNQILASAAIETVSASMRGEEIEEVTVNFYIICKLKQALEDQQKATGQMLTVLDSIIKHRVM